MRAKKGEPLFAEFIPKLGSNTLPRRSVDPFKDSIEIPDWCMSGSIVKKKIVILTPTNKSSLTLSNAILNR